MQIVIDIDNELYQMCKDLHGDADPVESAIANGTPIPKVQADMLAKIRAEIEQFAENPNFGDLSIGASCGALKAIEIIDKYKADSEVEK